MKEQLQKVLSKAKLDGVTDHEILQWPRALQAAVVGYERSLSEMEIEWAENSLTIRVIRARGSSPGLECDVEMVSRDGQTFGLAFDARDADVWKSLFK